jgi:hypothetical protein
MRLDHHRCVAGGVQVVVEQAMHGRVPDLLAVVRLGQFGGVGAEQVVAGVPAGSVLGDQVCPGPASHTAHRPRPAIHDDINWPKKPHLHDARPHGGKQCQSTSMNRFRSGGDGTSPAFIRIRYTAGTREDDRRRGRTTSGTAALGPGSRLTQLPRSALFNLTVQN